MAKVQNQPDVLVLGDHPCAYLAAALLKTAGSLVCHAKIPGEELPDRLVLINPAFFELHPLLEQLKKNVDLCEVTGLRFLSDDKAVSSEHRSKSVVTYVASSKQVRSAMVKLAEEAGIKTTAGDALEIHGVDESGVDVTVGRSRCRPKLILLAGSLPPHQQRMLGLSGGWDGDVLHNYSYVKIKGPRCVERDPRPLMPMSLDLNGSLAWGWLIPGDNCLQAAVAHEHSAGVEKSVDLLRHWLGVLVAHNVLKSGVRDLDLSAVVTLELPLAGALSQDSVANRTLLFGPAGGFYSACAEDIYPCCWSAVFAAEAARKSLREQFVQDALQQYRNRWGATLGDYLRGPQENLRFLLPMVYRNRAMTDRLAEAILTGAGVVR